jgi:NAD(P)H-nitrite reductase large subunit
MKKEILNKLPEILQKDMDDNLCTCNSVLKKDIINAIADGANTLEKVRSKTYATDGNGCCQRQVARLIECINGEELK